jgi:hypothetical protein
MNVHRKSRFQILKFLKAAFKISGFNRFKQVIDAVYFKSLDCILVVCRSENNRRVYLNSIENGEA